MKRFALLLLTFLLAGGLCTPASAAEVRLRLGPEGEILGWLVAGPFPNPTDREFKQCKGFETDYLTSLGGESKAAPSAEGGPSMIRGGVSWHLVAADAGKGLDLSERQESEEPSVAYAYAALVSPAATDARLLFGSDDGVKIWVNGDLVHTSHKTSGVKRDEEKVDIRLKPGTNRLLFKVDQHFGGWGLIARIVNRDGSPVSRLLESLGIEAWRSRAEPGPLRRIVDMAIGKPGSLDMVAVADYLSWGRKTAMWMPWLQGNPDNAKALQDELERRRNRLRSSPVDADVLSCTVREASLAIEAEFDATWTVFSKEIQDPKPLLKADPAKEDYVRVADGGRYFVHADGKFYTPLGYNHNPDWTPLYQCAPGTPAYEPEVTERFFRHLHDCGVNLIRMMDEFPGGGHFIEKPVGTFRPEHVAWLDYIFTYARKYDIKLMVTPYDTFWMSHRWDENPFNAKNGGPVEKKADFITKREAIEAQKRRWKYIIDRWGNTGTVFAWELLNESDYWWEASPEQVTAWAKEMGDYVRTYEKAKWGWNHLITISTGHPMPGHGWGVLAYRLPEMDLATTHLYIGASNAPDEPIGPALAEKEGVTYSLGQIKDSRPYIDGENGPINRWIADEKLDDEVFHNMSWAHLASGGAGSGLRWPYRNPHHLTEGMLGHLSRMSRFAKDVPWKKLTGNHSEIEVSVPEGWAGCATGTKECALVWVAAPKRSAGTISISWPDAPNSTRYRCYDTRTGDWFSKGQVSGSAGDFSIAVTEKHSSVAVILE